MSDEIQVPEPAVAEEAAKPVTQHEGVHTLIVTGTENPVNTSNRPAGGSENAGGKPVRPK